MQNGFVQFKDESGKVITTNGTLTFLQDGGRNIAFYGTRGKSVLSDTEFTKVLMEIGFAAPAATPAPDAADDDADFVLPA